MTTNGQTDVFVYTMETGKNTLASINTSGTGSGQGTSNNPTISSDGSTVAFDSLANNLDPKISGVAPFSDYQVYARNLGTKVTTLVSDSAAANAPGNNTSIAPSLSANGQVVAFQSDSTNLVSTPVTGGSIQDVYVRNLAQSAATLVSLEHRENRTAAPPAPSPRS